MSKEEQSIYFKDFDFMQFISNQSKINNKFPCPEKTVIKIIDSFIMHITEECFEVDYTTDTLEEYQFEIIDAIMYIGSLFNDLLKEYDVKDIEILKETFKPIKVSLVQRIKPKFDAWEIISELIRIRRKFPERKYHKPYKEISKEEHQKRIFESLLILYYLESKMLNDYIYVPYEKFIEMIQTKEDYILSI